MNEHIKGAIERGDLLLVLGAGASAGSKDRADRPLLMGGELARELAKMAGLPYSDEPLKHVYAAAFSKLGDKVNRVLEDRYMHCSPSPEYLDLARYPWPRIYTLNIDDSLDRALSKTSSQTPVVRGLLDHVEDQDQFFGRLDLIKLNGSVNQLAAGVIFSPQQYARTAAQSSQWYEQLGVDFFRYTVLFIGTKLDESVFFQQIERYRERSGATEGDSYLLVPIVTEIERASLAAQKIIHVSGSLETFTQWLKATFPTPMKPMDVAISRRPQIAKVLFGAKDDADKYRYAKLFQFVERIDRGLPTMQRAGEDFGSTRQFYQGFKPTWADIHERVPAELDATRKALAAINEAIGKQPLVVIHGPAGSGKTTLLMQLAYQLMSSTTTPIYFVSQPVDQWPAILTELENLHERYIVFTDKLDSFAHELKDVLAKQKLVKGTIVASERQNIWTARTREHLWEFAGTPLRLSDIAEPDAEAILKKVEEFGPWQRLGKMKPADRINELVAKAKRQLLIGLLETTSGVGFEQLIEEDYKRLRAAEERAFLLLVSLATVHRLAVPESLIHRALRNLGIPLSVPRLLMLTAGMTIYANGTIFARHPVYVRYLLESVINPKEIHAAVKALLGAFGAYKVPIARYAGRNEASIYRAIANHRFLYEMLKGDQDLIVDVYRSFEKTFQADGLFWLHHGLALRDLGRQDDAFAKLQSSFDVYPSVQAEHALAQQKMILARDSKNKSKAYTLLAEAKASLDRLDHVRELVDSYPIVTLSEGHCAVVLLHEGKERAQTVAKEYLTLLGRRVREGRGVDRIDDCIKRLTKFAANPSLSALVSK